MAMAPFIGEGNGEKPSTCAVIALSVCVGLLLAGLEAGFSAAGGATGSAILSAAGHDVPSTEEMAQYSSVGGAIIALPLVAILLCLQKCCGRDSENNKQNQIGGIVLAAGVSAVGGALGAFIFGAPVAAAAAAAATGTAVLSGGMACLSAACGG